MCNAKIKKAKTTKASFWEGAASHVQQLGFSIRTSGSCRSKIMLKLCKKFVSPKEAKKQLNDASESDLPSSHTSSSPPLESLVKRLLTLPPQPDHSYSPMSVEHLAVSPDVSPEVVAMDDPLFEAFVSLPQQDQVNLVSDLLSHIADKQHSVSVPKDFVPLLLKGMAHLNRKNKPNLIYDFCRGLGSLRPDGSDSLIPTSRMPFGLLQYLIEFFTTQGGLKLYCPEDYKQWLETMYSLFGSKWSKLHCGPMYSIESTEQGSGRERDDAFNRLKARVNVPGLGERALRTSIANSSFYITCELQMKVIEEALRLLPSANWWIKADGVDVISSLEESMRLEWNGDVDLGDGHTQALYEEYCGRLKSAEDLDLSLGNVHSVAECVPVLLEIQQAICDDLEFINKCLISATSDYSKMVTCDHSVSEKKLRNAGWKVDELSRLNKAGRQVKVDIQCVVELADQGNSQLHRIHRICKAVTGYLKGLYRHKRTAATHVLAVMISPDDRRRKPYALPVQCIPYVSLSHLQIRSIVTNVAKAMKEKGMNVVGFVANGEFNSLRSMGYSRPLSVLKLKSNARAKYAQMGKAKMMRMLSPTCTSTGDVVGEEHNCVVPREVLCEVLLLKRNGMTMEDIVSRLRCRTVPSGYPIHSWRTLSDGESESLDDKLRSILAQMEFTHVVRSWDQKGVPFRTYIYVPEEHPELGTVFHEREDEGHVYKRMRNSTLMGGPKRFKLERFNEAVYDESANLTYTALIGRRKQSIRDVENFFSSSVADFMNRKGYTYEAQFVTTVRNWRRACDERGLTQLKRCQFNYELLNMLLDELMPWHRTQYDLSLMEVNRPTRGVLGFTRETVIALTTNIESREYVRRTHPNPEHPRASTTDDVECLFSIMRDLAGKHFTVRTWNYNWRKVCSELSKRLDPDLGFFYHTSSHDRFYEGETPSFDKEGKSKRNPRNRRVRRRELLTDTVFGRASLPEPGATSLRLQFHNVAVELPPPPSSVLPLTDHTYTS